MGTQYRHRVRALALAAAAAVTLTTSSALAWRDEHESALGTGHDPNFRPTCETRGEPDVKTQRS